MIPIEYVCFLNQTGYAQAAISNIIALEQSKKYSVRINCIHKRPQRKAFSESLYKYIRKLCNKTHNPDAVQVFHTIPDMHRRVSSFNKKIAYATFESFAPPLRWIKSLNRCDSVIAPSEFNKVVFEKNGVEQPIVKVPHGIDLSLWNDSVKPLKNYSKFTFLFVGTWRKRKGWDLLLEAWAKEFSQRDNVQLIIKTDRTDRAERESKQLLEQFRKDYASILFEREVFDEKTIPSFFRSADCFISPTLGEGFGLPAIQSMAVKVPVIITNFAGCSEYADEGKCRVLEPSGFMIHQCLDQIPQFSNQKWPRIRIDDIQKYMRCVFDEKEENRKRSEEAYRFVHENYGYDNIIKNFDYTMEMTYGASNVKAIAN